MTLSREQEMEMRIAALERKLEVIWKAHEGNMAVWQQEWAAVKAELDRMFQTEH
jgi:hypothetical protein